MVDLPRGKELFGAHVTGRSGGDAGGRRVHRIDVRDFLDAAEHGATIANPSEPPLSLSLSPPPPASAPALALTLAPAPAPALAPAPADHPLTTITREALAS